MKTLGTVLLVLFFTYGICTAEKQTGHVEYTILFDAGSSGTRMEITNFLNSGPSLKPSDVVQLDADPHKVKPGLDDLHDDPSKVEAYLMPLLEAAKKTIPKDKHSSTPIFLLATAGMRLLPEDQAEALLNEVRKLFNDKAKCPFLFQEDNDARIIKGWVEGIYSWVTINFLEGIFGGDKKPFGALDLGGASHQNSWEFNNKTSSDVFTIEVAGNKYNIFSRSYLGYGQDQARETYLDFIAKGSNCGDDPTCVVKSPCHNNGFNDTLEFHGQKRIFEGTDKFDICDEIVHDLFFCHDSENLEKCPFSDQPKLEGKFYGISAIYYVLTDIGAVCSDCKINVATPRKVLTYAKSFCGKDYEDVKEDPYAKDNCFGSVYIYQLLTSGYKLSPSKIIKVATTLNGFDLSWTLGAVLHNSGILKE